MDNIIQLKQVSKSFESSLGRFFSGISPSVQVEKAPSDDRVYSTMAQSKLILSNINLTIAPHEFVVLRGENGAGKSVLLSLILGLLKPTCGDISLMGLSPKQPHAKDRVGVVLQDTGLPPNLKVRELVELVGSYYKQSLPADVILSRVKLSAQSNLLTSELSGGQRQRLLLALALVGQPDFLILDEPTRNLDEQGFADFWQQIEHCQQRGMAILMVTNNQADWQKLDQLANRYVTLKKLTGADEEVQLEERQLRPIASIESRSRSVSEEDEVTEPSVTKAAFWTQFKLEIVQILRTRLFVLLLLLPIVLVIFLPKNLNRIELVVLVLLILLAFVLQLSTRIAVERSQHWLRLIRATPVLPTHYIAAKLAMAFAVCCVPVGGFLLASVWHLSLHLAWYESVKLIVALTMAALPILGLSLALCYLIRPENIGSFSAYSLFGIILLSGMGIFPKTPQPRLVSDLMALSPFYHIRQFVWDLAQLPGSDGYLLEHALWTTWAAVCFVGLAIWAYQRDEVAQ